MTQNNMEIPVIKVLGAFAISCLAAISASTPAQALSGQERNAIRSAKAYLDFSGFSRLGLIEQLSSAYGDQYPIQVATTAVDSLSVDWNVQAARSAKQYLEMMGFSCNGLIDQLSSEYGDQYTRSQATHGARQAGAC